MGWVGGWGGGLGGFSNQRSVTAKGVQQLHECSVTLHNPIPPSYGAITRQNQPLIRWCYLIKTAQCVAHTLIVTNLEKEGGRVCDCGGKEGGERVWIK